MSGIRKSTSVPLHSFLVLGLLALILISRPGGANAAEPSAVPTFHALGIYWSPEGGATDRHVAVTYRRPGDTAWLKGLPMKYNPIDGTDADKADYRGSIVNLTPKTHYEIRLALEGTDRTARLTAATWSEDFPVGAAGKVASRNTPLNITESGTPDAYRLYDGTGSTIDVQHNANNCIIVKASYVILRGFTLKGAGITAHPASGGNAGALRIEEGHDVIIEGCDISDWGRPAKKSLTANNGRNMDAGIICPNSGTRRVVIQRCRVHHPTYDTNTWYEPKKMTHTSGPQCVVFNESEGNHVVRYNEFFSDRDHMYNDVLGGGENASYRGCPGPDSDIYCNIFSHSWDDAIEVEGSNRNVRVWHNYITEAMLGLGNAPTCIGPLFFWRNVMNRSQWHPNGPGGMFVKMGYATGEEWMKGQIYLFHNTIFQEGMKGCAQGIGGKSRIMRHTVTRNNILHLRSPDGGAISSVLNTADNDFDYDLYNGSVPKGHEAHGIKGEPRYVSGARFDASGKTGNFQLAADSPGHDAGEAIPNFSDGFTGAAPDMGAQENGWDAMRFGVKANFQPENAKPEAGTSGR